MSLLRVPHTFEDDINDLIQLLANVLVKGTSLRNPLDGGTDPYCAKVACGLRHGKAFREAKEELLKSMKAMQSADTEWVFIPKSSSSPALMLDRLSLDT